MKKIIIPILCLLVASSCSDWLNVRPSDRIDEKTAFSNLAGFRQALNGIYVELNNNNLYGRALTSEFVEILAQRYGVKEQAVNYDLLSKYEYSGSNALSRISSIWGSAYNLIANTNLLIKNCDLQRGTVLTEDYYGIIKGEALALRAMLHFDLFRLFGPIYDKESPMMSIPYYKEFGLVAAPTVTSHDFMANVIKDLIEAEQLLKEDPIVTLGPKGNERVTFLRDRNLRLNYYAVHGLLARAYLYIGDNENALTHAKKVIEVQEKWFPWINPMDLQGNTPDRMFSTELLFSLQNLNRNSIFSGLFDGAYLKEETLLAPIEKTLNYIFDDKQDYRYVYWFGNTAELGGTVYKIFNKYQGVTNNDELKFQMIPMIRVSEMYLIAAEAEEDNSVGVTYFNAVRNSRGVPGRSQSNYKYYMEEEYRMEFFGEGQLFFFYKRLNYDSFMSHTLYNEVKMNNRTYVLPIPNGESDYN